MSTVEAELMAASEGSREAIWLGRLLIELTKHLDGNMKYAPKPVQIGVDNQGALALICRGTLNISLRTKHLEIRQFHG